MHKYEKSFLSQMIIVMLLGFLTVFTLVSIGMTIECSKETYPIYEYIDLDGNVKEGVDCSYKFERYKRGGQGAPVCLSGDGAITLVKQYKIVRYTKQPYCNVEKSDEENG